MYYIFIAFISIVGVREPFSIDWNMFDSSSNPEFCCIGFGDWCFAAVGIPSEGPHPGLDFKPPFVSDSVLSPASVTTWVQNTFPDATGWEIVIDDEEWQFGDCTGWSIGHVDSLFYLGHEQLAPKEVIGKGVYQGGSEWFPHIHLNWYQDGLWGNNVNPFNYLTPPVGYDYLCFRRIPYIEDALRSDHGIVFDIQDGYPNLDETGDMNHWHYRTFIDFKMFQEEVFGQVDFIVSPASVDCIAPFADSMAGVKEILVGIKTLSGSSTAYSSRKFIDFINGIIPSIYEHMDEYNAMFFDPVSIGWPGYPAHWHFNTSYIASNCGCMNGPFNTCYDNIWPNYLPPHNWNTGEFNRGCWDTRLRDESTYQTGYPDHAFIPENAAFPDGYYAVEITATTHGNDVGTILLPHENKQPDVVRGISVNNFYPHVREVRFQCGPYADNFFTAEYLFEDFMKPGRSERTLDDWFGPRPSGIATVTINYSEPVSNASVWITCVSGDDTVWTSDFRNPYEMTDDPASPFSGSGGFYICNNIPPDGYLGKCILSISANDESICEYELDSDPVTIPLPINGYYCFNDLYEPGITEFEWNVGRSVTGIGIGISSDTLIVKTENSGDVLYITTISEAVSDPYIAASLIPPICTRGDGQEEHKAFCEPYAGYWLRDNDIFCDNNNRCYITSVPS